MKGEWRLKLLQEDLAEISLSSPLHVWDAGCGLGQMSLWLAERGHHLSCCDISYKMLQKTKERFAKAGLEADFYQAPAQQMLERLSPQDLVLFHAVLEWLAKPLETLEEVSSRVKEGGYLSLLFFNHNSIIFRNTLRGGWRLQMLIEDKWYGRGKKLTPPHPQRPEVIVAWLKEHGYEIKAHTGIRVFHDYLPDEVLDKVNQEELIEMEYAYCRQETFRNMGRYVHILAQKGQ